MQKLAVVYSSMVALALSNAVPRAKGQDLGEVARQERQRRARLARHSPVLTNEDLRREVILPPELRNQILHTWGKDAASVPDVPPGAFPLVQRSVEPPQLGSGQQFDRGAASRVCGREAVLSLGAQEPVSIADEKTATGGDCLGDIARRLRAIRTSKHAAGAEDDLSPQVQLEPDAPSFWLAPQRAAEPAAGHRPAHNLMRRVNPTVSRSHQLVSSGIKPTMVNSHLSIRGLRPQVGAHKVSISVPCGRHCKLESGPELLPMARSSVRVRRGDSLWRLAQLYLGSGRQWRTLWLVNPQLRNPAQIRVGDRIFLPRPSFWRSAVRRAPRGADATIAASLCSALVFSCDEQIRTFAGRHVAAAPQRSGTPKGAEALRP